MRNKNITITLPDETWDILRNAFPPTPALNEKTLTALYMFVEAYHIQIRPKGLPPVIDEEEEPL